jgi:hypothetical protein
MFRFLGTKLIKLGLFIPCHLLLYFVQIPGSCVYSVQYKYIRVKTKFFVAVVHLVHCMYCTNMCIMFYNVCSQFLLYTVYRSMFLLWRHFLGETPIQNERPSPAFLPIGSWL